MTSITIKYPTTELTNWVERYEELLLAAQNVRAAQKRYFKDRTAGALTEAKRLEKEFDTLLAGHQQLQLNPMTLTGNNTIMTEPTSTLDGVT